MQKMRLVVFVVGAVALCHLATAASIQESLAGTVVLGSIDSLGLFGPANANLDGDPVSLSISYDPNFGNSQTFFTYDPSDGLNDLPYGEVGDGSPMSSRLIINGDEFDYFTTGLLDGQPAGDSFVQLLQVGGETEFYYWLTELTPECFNANNCAGLEVLANSTAIWAPGQIGNQAAIDKLFGNLDGTTGVVVCVAGDERTCEEVQVDFSGSVPEPATWVLFVLGGSALSVVAGRRAMARYRLGPL